MKMPIPPEYVLASNEDILDKSVVITHFNPMHWDVSAKEGSNYSAAYKHISIAA